MTGIVWGTDIETANAILKGIILNYTEYYNTRVIKQFVNAIHKGIVANFSNGDTWMALS